MALDLWAVALDLWAVALDLWAVALDLWAVALDLWAKEDLVEQPFRLFAITVPARIDSI